MIYIQVQFTYNQAGKTHQMFLSSCTIGIQHKEIPVLDTLTEPRFGMNNRPVLTISTGVVQDTKALKLPLM